GFEPTVPFWSTQHFQCCTFGRSVTSPEVAQCNPDPAQRAIIGKMHLKAGELDNTTGKRTDDKAG
ncbi:MAG: hypothetical protein JXR24_08240, partial [Acidithiobacillaceae bacterium]|nr:hypothetical protein [Acidithiobacillaceae bacterium]